MNGANSVNRLNAQYGLMPPQAIDLEEAILGALMLERDAITRVELEPQVFYKDEHRKIFSVIQKLDNEGKQIDLVTVTVELRNLGLLEEVGGPSRITEITRRVAAAAHIEQHVRILLQFYVRRELIRVSSEIAKMCYDTSLDLEEVVNLYESATLLIDDAIFGRKKGRDLFHIMNDLTKVLEERQAKSRNGLLTGIDTGFGALNRMTAGWQSNSLIVFASRPAMGKTAIGVNRFAKAAAREGKWVNVFSLEMDDISLGERLAIGASGIDPWKFKSGTLTPVDWQLYNEAVAELKRLPIWIDDSPYVSTSHIRNASRRNKRQNKCDLIIIDYLQLAKAQGAANRNREQEVSEMSRSLKALAKELKVPIIVLSQLSREVEKRAKKEPILSDLRESGAIEQDADLVIFPYRENYYGLNNSEIGSSEGTGKLIVAKNRHGDVGYVKFWHNASMTEFSDSEPTAATMAMPVGEDIF